MCKAFEDYKAEGIAEGKAEGIVEGKAEGKAEGRIEGAIEAIISLVKDGLLSVKIASERLNMNESEITKLINNTTED